MSAQTYITPTMLAILAHPTFQLLYERVAIGLVDVANLQSKCNGTDNFSAVLQGLSIGKKESLGKTLESPSGNPATVFMGLKASTSCGALIVHMGMNATSVHKPLNCSGFFQGARLTL
ncbi:MULTISPECIES: hypothetical protein [Pseudomonas]|uniref:Uncharacterized protein n=1 Tax=Pseudomonas fitomaticsae TaxID=2837969 RepID=A0ABY3PYL6_9PSED|nr:MULTISPECIES: hypothetical protein [Pseudomonas]MCU0089617.1 hypothetical protein [Pseudomonas koreensis]UFP99012.1 hypothetical protein KJY40_23700 [Pseudomonas fitomaticsae]